MNETFADGILCAAAIVRKHAKSKTFLEAFEGRPLAHALDALAGDLETVADNEANPQ